MTQTIADMIVTALVQAGVKRMYGIVGDSLNPLSDALRRDGRIQWVHVRHEEVAAFAAGAEAQLTGELVVCAGSCGPGNLHLINGLYDCQRSGARVLAIASHIPTSEIGTSYFQETHPTLLFSECSHYCELVTNPQQVAPVLQIAMQRAISQAGVSVLVLPGDVAGMPAPKEQWPTAIIRTNPLIRPAADELQKLADVINRSERITIYAGAGCADARDELLALAEQIKAPIAYAFRGKQFLEYENPYAIGMTGLLGWGAAYDAMHTCDLLLLLGTDFPYKAFMPTTCPIVQIDLRAEQLGRRAKIDLGLCGDIRETLRALVPLLTKKEQQHHLERALRAHNQAIQKMQVYVTHGAEQKPIRPEYVAALVNELAAADAIFTVDTGTPNIWAARYIQSAHSRRMLGSFSHGSMANAMPQAIGAAMAFPGRQVIALAGDGGLSMLLGDLITIAQHQLPIKMIVFNNGQLDFVKLEMQQAGLLPWQTELWNPNFAKVAEAIGMRGLRIEEPKELFAGLETALSTPGPVVVDIVVDGNALSLPPHITIGMIEGFTLTMAKQVLEGQASDVIETITHNVRLRP
ncbi:MAG: ubiquinone-dependent pyruvate dehydrogenase [Roseiflexaceae bacterium]|nr:ubiquinone-dependent pyruvate dehydrogenase [Roseiflexaceae bacterium]